MPMKSDDPRFKGFRQPQANWSKLPHQLIEQLPIFDALSEVKVTLYILRHTWGYREYGKKKRLTVDDFVNGRKRSNGTRIDNGTGLSEQGVRDGLKRAIDHGFIVCQIDDSDKARIKKYYALNLATAQSLVSEVQSLDPQTLDLRPQTLDPNPLKSVPRTKKETTERNQEKETHTPNGSVSSVKEIGELIQAWLIGNGMQDIRAHYKNTGYRNKAQTLIDMRISADDLRDYMKDARKTWAKDQPVTWTNVIEHIEIWKAKRKPKPVFKDDYEEVLKRRAAAEWNPVMKMTEEEYLAQLKEWYK